MKIFIDADACPVTRETVDIAKRHNTECIIVCDTAHEFFSENVTVITVSQGKDSADLKIVNSLKTGDIVVTGDYGLAAIVLARGGIPINADGVIYSNDNIDAMLLTRYENDKIRRSGRRHKGPKKRTPEQTAAFIFALNSLLK